MQESSVTGVERAHCQTSQAEEATAVDQTGEDLDQTSEESVESAVSFNQRVTERFATSAIGSAKVRYHLFPSKSEVLEREVVREQMKAQKGTVSEIADLLQLHGVKADHKARRTGARDHPDVSSRSDLLLSELPLLLSRTINGVQRCDLISLQPNHPSHHAKVARLLLHQLRQLQSQQADQS
jgi:hypothetical protein